MKPNNQLKLQDIVTLRHALRSDESSLLDKYANRINVIERGRPWFVLGAVLGGLLTGLARLFEGTTGIVVTVVGLVAAAVFGSLVGWHDFKKLELGVEARNAMRVADEALTLADAHAEDLGSALQLGTLRDERSAAADLMRESMLASLIGKLPTSDTIDVMLDTARLRIAAACRFEASEYWAITVFTTDATTVEMIKIAALWNDATTSAQTSRAWRRGEGITGVVWRNEGPVVIPDASLANMDANYPVPETKLRSHDARRYRSAAAYPVLVGDQVWGVVTATSDRPGRFAAADPNAVEATHTVRDIASFVSLIAMTKILAEDRAGPADA